MTVNRLRSLALGLAVASTAAASPAAAQDSVKVERATSDYITRAQLLESRANNLYEVIESLHNNWLNERFAVPQSRATSRADTSGKVTYNADMGADNKSTLGGAGGIQVYVDGTRVGGTSELKLINPRGIASIRRISGTDAQARFGVGHSSGVIYVLTGAYTTPNDR